MSKTIFVLAANRVSRVSLSNIHALIRLFMKKEVTSRLIVGSVRVNFTPDQYKRPNDVPRSSA